MPEAIGRLALAKLHFRSGATALLAAVYLWSGQGPGPANTQLLASIAQVIKAVGLPWMAFGDWQMSPADLLSTKWLEHQSGTIIRQPEHVTATCWQSAAGTYIDYFVASPWMTHLLTGKGLDPNSPWGTHAAITVSMQIRHKSVVTQRLFKPIDLPEGAVPDRLWPAYFRQAERERLEVPPAVEASLRHHPRYESMMALGQELERVWKALEIGILDNSEVQRADWKRYIGRGGWPRIIRRPLKSPKPQPAEDRQHL